MLSLPDALPICGRPAVTDAPAQIVDRLRSLDADRKAARFQTLQRRRQVVRGTAAPLVGQQRRAALAVRPCVLHVVRSEEHTSELQSLMRISYAVFCLKQKTAKTTQTTST